MSLSKDPFSECVELKKKLREMIGTEGPILVGFQFVVRITPQWNEILEIQRNKLCQSRCYFEGAKESEPFDNLDPLVHCLVLHGEQSALTDSWRISTQRIPWSEENPGDLKIPISYWSLNHIFPFQFELRKQWEIMGPKEAPWMGRGIPLYIGYEDWRLNNPLFSDNRTHQILCLMLGNAMDKDKHDTLGVRFNLSKTLELLQVSSSSDPEIQELWPDFTIERAGCLKFSHKFLHVEIDTESLYL